MPLLAHSAEADGSAHCGWKSQGRAHFRLVRDPCIGSRVRGLYGGLWLLDGWREGRVSEGGQIRHLQLNEEVKRHLLSTDTPAAAAAADVAGDVADSAADVAGHGAVRGAAHVADVVADGFVVDIAADAVLVAVAADTAVSAARFVAASPLWLHPASLQSR